MDYALTEQQQSFRDAAERFSRESLRRNTWSGHVTIASTASLTRDGSARTDRCDIPEEFGGLGESSVAAGIIIEQIACGDFNAAMSSFSPR